MLFNKWTFSLMSLVVLIAFGLVCAVPSAFADGDNEKDHFDIGVTIAAGETMIDVSAEDGFQIATGRDRESRDFTAGPASLITLTFTFSKGVINLHTPATGTADENALTSSADAFGLDDVYVEAFDVEGRSLGAFSVDDVTAAVVDTDTAALTSFADANNPGRVFLLRIDEAQIANAYHAARGGSFEIHKLSFFMPAAITKKTNERRVAGEHGVKNADLAHFAASFDDHEGKSHAHFNKASNVFNIDLVDDDEGEAQYLPLATNATVGAAPATGTPGVVAITRILDRNAFQPIETGPFNVRIILTEEPKGGLTTDLINVMNGSATALTKGVTLKGAITVTGATRASELTTDNVNYYIMGTADTLAGQDALPEATGRDNMYHQYVATITPNAGVDGYATISINQFADNVLPVSNMYVPLTAAQRNATILTGPAEIARDARLKNETLMVRVNSAGDAKVAAAKAAYEVRSKDNTGIFNLNPNLKAIGKGLVIPANGYLVLARGKTDSDPVSGVVNVDAKLSKKLTAAQKSYNVVYDFGLPFPASDLSNFFRNGGSLSLVYANIPAATGSGHGDSKASKDGDTTHADYTGYVGATSTAIAAGDVIISEVMWGLDANSVNSQYIELHNTTAAAIGIDHLEWAISVGSAPAPFTAIDTVGNNPAPVAPATSGYWQVPGSDGVSEIEPASGFFTLVDIVSMSRVMGGTDGTAAASWAASMRPSANVSGRRIGTPGAANVYVKAPPPPPTPPAPTADVATSEDIMISEVMVASNSGRLPQWIELANVSGKEVSLSGWSIDIDNDSDASSSSYRVSLGDVTVGKDQTVLVISKAGRNSGTGMGADAKGALREDRIVDVQSQVSPGADNYMLVSEIAFKLSLVLPPGPGTGTVKTGDVVGNLGMGWELPAADGTNRSSLIRREMGATTEIMGTDAAGWVLASDTGLGGAYVGTYYGDKDDMGTPGYDAGGALPVELSKFSAARDRVTGQVTIAWETQSELNNAGFFIKRSQQRNGQYVVVNTAMVAGAGTTSEKQSYTYTDTTAKPNIVYYYQIEDVSLDGNRQTLTRGHRLKGHIGAAGKATTTWGDLKTSLDQ